jgi:hypothetical protein
LTGRLRSERTKKSAGLEDRRLNIPPKEEVLEELAAARCEQQTTTLCGAVLVIASHFCGTAIDSTMSDYKYLIATVTLYLPGHRGVNSLIA